MKRTICTLYLAAALFAFGTMTSAQVATGTPAFNSFGGGPFDTVNLGNLNVHFSVPIIQKAGRGLPFTYSLNYDSSVWTPVTVNGTTTWQHSGTWGWQNATPQNSTPYVSYSQTTSGNTPCGYMGTGSYYTISYGNFVYHDQFGVKHPFNVGATYIVVSGCAPPNGPPSGPEPTYAQSASASDGSNYTITIGVAGQYSIGGSLVNCNGQTIVAPWLTAPPTQSNNYSAIDANGNTISFNASNGQFTDTLGKVVLTVAGSNPVTYTYTGQTSNAISWQLHYSTYNVKTHFNCGIAEFSLNSVLLASSISLPDGTSYSFTYEPTPGFSGYVTGRLASVTLPTGGSISYQYTGGSNGIVCADGSTAGLTRTVNPGGQWTYARTQVSGNQWQTTVTTPPDSQNSGSASDDIVISFEKDSNSGNGATYSFYETNRQAYQGTHTAGTLLLTTASCWNGNTSNCTTTAVSSPITQRNVTLQYPNGGLQSQTNTFINACGLVTEADQYGYGSGAPGSLQRKTTISYAALGNNIVDRPSVVTVSDGGGNTLSKTAYSYDESAYPLNTTTAVRLSYKVLAASSSCATS